MTEPDDEDEQVDKIQRAARERQKRTGEKYTVARRAVVADFEALKASERASEVPEPATGGAGGAVPPVPAPAESGADVTVTLPVAAAGGGAA